MLNEVITVIRQQAISSRILTTSCRKPFTRIIVVSAVGSYEVLFAVFSVDFGELQRIAPEHLIKIQILLCGCNYLRRQY